MDQVKSSLVITSIASPNAPLKKFSEGCKQNNIDYFVIGDKSSPTDFKLDGCQFYSLEEQRSLDFSIVEYLPEKHYSRKNIGYLLAISKGAKIIIESDDDNLPLENFWESRKIYNEAYVLKNKAWFNVYKHFTEKNIWARGLPLEYLHSEAIDVASLNYHEVLCPIQQGLANGNPDVDAIYRLVLELPVTFNNSKSIALGKGSWHPFNSQNTTWFDLAFPLLYLPTYCSFRMTDIWRSFVAQKIAWVNDWHILYHQPNVFQERNEHNLLKDFEQEVPGYLYNSKITLALNQLNLKTGTEYILENLMICYDSLVVNGFIDKKELKLVDAWISDINEPIKQRNKPILSNS